jgi:multiple sugar transport system substrate-binding protein
MIVSLFLVSLPAIAAQNLITFWTMEMETERLELQKKIAQIFTAKTGIHVSVVPVHENRLAQKVAAASATGSLPDVLYHPMGFTLGWAQEGIIDARSATDVLNHLGKETFCKNALSFAGFSGGYAAIPIDGWHQLLLYRKDLFRKKGLPVPDSWNRILKAAQMLHNPPSIWGFEAATDPDQIYTQQVFEHFALSNGVGLTDPSGNVDLNTQQMIQTLEFYKALAQFTPRGNIGLFHTRKDYLSGRAAMIMWSPFILDELSGLRRDLLVLPDILQGKPGYLAKNTGFVSIIHGLKGTAQYSQINCLGITRDADRTPAKRWIKFLLTDGYLRWLDMAPEGKLPLRKGTRHDPNHFINRWMELEFGIAIGARISEYYGKDVTETILNSVKGLNHWGLAANRGALVSKIYEAKVIPKVLKQFLDDKLSASQAAREINECVHALE